MNIRQDRTFTVGATSDLVSTRLKEWANASDFVCTSDSPHRWVFRRGSSWQALYSFDIRKAPTEVTVEVVTEQPLTVRSTMHVRSLLQYTTPGDEKRVSEQLDVLVAHLKGAL